MGDHKIGQLMKDMAFKYGLTAPTGKKITNHSSRKTCVQKLKNAGVPRDKIIDVTGHQNVLSLNSYEGDDENQARELSNIISGCKQKVMFKNKLTAAPLKRDYLFKLVLPVTTTALSTTLQVQ